MTFSSSLEIASNANLKPLNSIAACSGTRQECLKLYGEDAAKIRLDRKI